MIKIYNFSRPFLTEKQPLIMHGLGPCISYIFKSQKKTKHGINLSYSYFKSSSGNENFEAERLSYDNNLGLINKSSLSDKILSMIFSVIAGVLC